MLFSKCPLYFPQLSKTNHKNKKQQALNIGLSPQRADRNCLNCTHFQSKQHLFIVSPPSILTLGTMTLNDFCDSFSYISNIQQIIFVPHFPNCKGAVNFGILFNCSPHRLSLFLLLVPVSSTSSLASLVSLRFHSHYNHDCDQVKTKANTSNNLQIFNALMYYILC